MLQSEVGESDLWSGCKEQKRNCRGLTLGLPRCEEIATLAPFSSRYLIVGTEARMRVSSVIFLPSSGTLRSHLISTFFPLRSASLRSLTDFFAAAIEITGRPPRRVERRATGATCTGSAVRSAGVKPDFATEAWEKIR